MTDLKLFIGSKRYSSWSMRPWLLMKYFDIPFEENIIPFITTPNKRELSASTLEAICHISPSRRVPVLHWGENRISESLAICEFLADFYPDINLWPQDKISVAKARSLCSEISSGLHNIKIYLPFIIAEKRKPIAYEHIDSQVSREIQYFINRIIDLKKNQSGSYLFGDFSIADAMLAPVLIRFYMYNVYIPVELEEYFTSMISLNQVNEWIENAKMESVKINEIEAIFNYYPNKADCTYKLG